MDTALFDDLYALSMLRDVAALPLTSMNIKCQVLIRNEKPTATLSDTLTFSRLLLPSISASHISR